MDDSVGCFALLLILGAFATGFGLGWDFSKKEDAPIYCHGMCAVHEKEYFDVREDKCYCHVEGSSTTTETIILVGRVEL